MFTTKKEDINLKTWCQATIYYVNNLVHEEEGRFMTLMELWPTINVTEYLVQLRTLLYNYLDQMWIFSESIILSFLFI